MKRELMFDLLLMLICLALIVCVWMLHTSLTQLEHELDAYKEQQVICWDSAGTDIENLKYDVKQLEQEIEHVTED